MARRPRSSPANLTLKLTDEEGEVVETSDAAEAVGARSGRRRRSQGADAPRSPTKKERLEKAIAEAVGAGKELHLESVDFADPNRPKTCLEVDFPILPINHVAAIEGNAGKPIYQMSKWWARRRSSVFRAMLIAAATKAPDDPAEAAKLVWDSYYGNHQKNKAFQKLKVADIFMGGGTTIVEGSRLGMQMYGNDLNPVAWFVVKNEMAQVDPAEVRRLLDHIEAEVKPQIMPFYACDCPRGHKGVWRKKSAGERGASAPCPPNFNPLTIPPEERHLYEYEGPEVIYTFWAKHGPCQATGCGHRTPIMPTPVVAIKTLTVKCWANHECADCGELFDIEQHSPRMAPAALYVVAPGEKPHAAMDEAGFYTCPHCGTRRQDAKAKAEGKSASLGKSKNKSVDLTLLVHPDWLKGSPGIAPNGSPYGGSVTDNVESTSAWLAQRALLHDLIEVRGELPLEISLPSQQVFFTDARGGTAPAIFSRKSLKWEAKKSVFVCQAPTCGQSSDVLAAVKRSEKSGPIAPYAMQGYCPSCDLDGRPYSGRFFATPNFSAISAAQLEWHDRCSMDLTQWWPRSELPYGFMTHHLNGGIPNHGFTHWWKMFNPRQLLVLTQLLRSISEISKESYELSHIILSAFQQYLRNENMFCFWDHDYDKLVPMMSNNNYHPKSTVVENCVFPRLGRGNWQSCTAGVLEGLEWARNPWEPVAISNLPMQLQQSFASSTLKSEKAFLGDPVESNATVKCSSATDLNHFDDHEVDLVITDPPFGNLLHYAELADFFHVWLRLGLASSCSTEFSGEYTPKTLEIISSRARHPEDPDGFYQKLLTAAWAEAGRVLKPSGILAFTFRHSEDEPWIAVLESLFDAGFWLEATFPIRSDETKGEGEFGSRKIEFDIIHVRRKRVEAPQPISWARLRRRILEDVRHLAQILAHHQEAGLQEADLQVIRRGKALEYYSRHYGQVYLEPGRPFSVKEALTGINQLLDDQRDASREAPPVDAEPYTRQFLRLFDSVASLERGEMQKFLRGTGVSPAEFVERGWCTEKSKVFHFRSPLEQAQQMKGRPRSGIGRDYDQAMLLIGACYPDSGIRVEETLKNPAFEPHPATGQLLDWFTRHAGSPELRDAARTAKQLYAKWQKENAPRIERQKKLFDLE